MCDTAEQCCSVRSGAIGRLGHADCVAQCPLSEAERKTYALSFSGFDLTGLCLALLESGGR